MCLLLAVGGGEDASGHIYGPRTQPADSPAAHQEEPGTQHTILTTFTKAKDTYSHWITTFITENPSLIPVNLFLKQLEAEICQSEKQSGGRRP